MTLLGTTKSFDEGVLLFGRDLADNLKKGDQDYLTLLDEADAYVTTTASTCPRSPPPGTPVRIRRASPTRSSN